MKKTYELWLDESGQFINESSLRNSNKKPSLVGGFLVEKSIAESIPYDELIDSGRDHAMHLNNTDKKEYVLPILEKMHNVYRAKQVFFENAEYEDENSGRQLYLRIIAEGILQLLQMLNAKTESVELIVLIAQRQDMYASIEQRKILPVEYVNSLRRLIANKREQHKIFFHENSSLEFQVKAAHTEYKLQLADFACNTRLTRDSIAFTEVRERVRRLHDDAYLFTLSELDSANYIKRSLTNGYISDAIMELYTTYDNLNRKKQLSLILERIYNTNYRLVKAQMKQCIADIMAFAAKEDDYEIGEAFLKKIIAEVVPLLEKAKQPYLDLKCAALIQLSDMYLREGDIRNARKTLLECRRTHEDMENSLELMFSYYQLIEKEALLAVNEFDYQCGADIMSKACQSFSNLMEFVQTDEHLKCRFPDIKSEYFGEALCMQIYAMLFLQRNQPDLYNELCKLSDLAFQQYPKNEGELEKHRQYRCHIELENGKYEEALQWLFLAKCHVKKELTEENIISFLNEISDKEEELSCQYYLMYYLLIVFEGKLGGNDFADKMYRALIKQKHLLNIVGIGVVDDRADDMHEVDISDVQADNTDILYHPMEIIYWKYASYSNLKENEIAAFKYYDKAVRICFAQKEYLTTYITGLGIEAERISCLYKYKKKANAQDAYERLVFRVKELLKMEMAEGTRQFLERFANSLQPTQEAMWKAARMFTY